MNDTTQEEPARCGVCGEPMPPGETMFKYHGYSGPCPKPPLPQKDDLLLRGQSIWQRLDPAIEDPVGTGLASKWIAEALSCIATLKAENAAAAPQEPIVTPIGYVAHDRKTGIPFGSLTKEGRALPEMTLLYTAPQPQAAPQASTAPQEPVAKVVEQSNGFREITPLYSYLPPTGTLLYASPQPPAAPHEENAAQSQAAWKEPGGA